jgi:hypothetical protein
MPRLSTEFSSLCLEEPFLENVNLNKVDQAKDAHFARVEEEEDDMRQK